jgi:CBS domain-containing protein
MPTVESLMSPDPVCCTADEAVVECARLMDRENLGMIPVVESIDTRKLIGVVTDRDLCIGIVAAARDANEVTVEECMTDELYTVRPSDDLSRALSLMQHHQVRRLPVIDDAGCVVGVLAQADVSLVASPSEVKETVSQISREEVERTPRGV